MIDLIFYIFAALFSLYMARMFIEKDKEFPKLFCTLCCLFFTFDSCMALSTLSKLLYP